MKVRKCALCGAVSIPFFGFATPCGSTGHGGHETRYIEVEEIEYNALCMRLYRTYLNVRHFDRARFDESAEPQHKKMLARGKELVENQNFSWI